MCLLEPLRAALHRRSGHAPGLGRSIAFTTRLASQGLCTCEPGLCGAQLASLYAYFTISLSLICLVSLSSNSPSDSCGRKEEQRLCVCLPWALLWLPLAVWFLLSTCLANSKLLNSVTCQSIDAYCSPKKRQSAREMAQRLTLLAPFSTGPDLRPPHSSHMPSIPANSFKPNCGGMETGGYLGLACFQPSGDVNPGLRRKPCSKKLCRGTEEDSSCPLQDL